jgi:hypothetical protein
MKPTIDELFIAERFTQLEVLPYEEMIPFIQREFTYPTPLIRVYIALNVLILMLMLVLGYLQVSSGKIEIGQIFDAASLGLAASLTLLIPIHEAIHGIAYKLAGAPKISFGGNCRKLYFYAVADRFVIGKRDFWWVAIAPFLVITLLSFVALFFVSLPLQWFFLGVLLLHTGACAGDFGMLAFYQRFPAGELYTFDDVTAKKAYFFQQKEVE